MARTCTQADWDAARGDPPLWEAAVGLVNAENATLRRACEDVAGQLESAVAEPYTAGVPRPVVGFTVEVANEMADKLRAACAESQEGE